ncbi:hypothetical protein ACLHDG_09070 [Sulfurovum sp. CS9]|uniref:hypothetical protein n=1 Tax=Sulfurovum sp. CS9 TaxID=3391146 RepID=UPI0039E805FB
MANRLDGRVKKLEDITIEVKRAAIVTFTGLGDNQDYTADTAKFTIGDESDLTYEDILKRGYEVMTFMPRKDMNK